MLKLSGLIFCVMPIKSIVRKGEMPEFPDRVKEKAVLDMALRIRLMVLMHLSCKKTLSVHFTNSVEMDEVL